MSLLAAGLTAGRPGPVRACGPATPHMQAGARRTFGALALLSRTQGRRQGLVGRRVLRACVSARVTGEPQRDLLVDSSTLVNKEIVLLLFQLELDQQLQRALNYESFEAAQDIRQRRQQVDEALKELQAAKGPACGARVASKSGQADLVPTILRLRGEMQRAVEEERYSDAAALRDQLAPLEAEARAAAEESSDEAEPRFALGEVVVHATKGYRAVVCGWDLRCCESAEWQEAAGVSNPSQVFYQLLVDVRDWPPGEDQPPIAYVGEGSLASASNADFSLNAPLNGSGLFSHPYSYLLFLGPDGQGNMLPCRQLRDKYSAQRRDVYAPGEEGMEGGSGGTPGGGGDGGSPKGGGGGWPKIPGIDMSSLED